MDCGDGDDSEDADEDDKDDRISVKKEEGFFTIPDDLPWVPPDGKSEGLCLPLPRFFSTPSTFISFE